MQVPVEVRESPGRGRGVFSTADIAAGTMVWDFHKATVRVYTEAEAKTMCEALFSEQTLDSATTLFSYAYWSIHKPGGPVGLYLIDLVNEDGRFFNHSFEPNILLGSAIDSSAEKKLDNLCSYAIRNIKAGEELLDDYNTYADGEAELGWLNSSIHVSSDQKFSLDGLLLDVVAKLQAELAALGAETAHLKTIGLWEGFFGVANLVNSTTEPELSLPSNCDVQEVDLIVNARVACDPEELEQVVRSCVEVAGQRIDATVEFRQTQSFRPGRPVPTHRYADGE